MLDLTALRLESAKPRIRAFAEANLEQWIKDTVLDSCYAFAMAAGMSQRYLDSIELRKKGTYAYEIRLEYWGPKGEPLGLWFEKGTKPHIIEAKYAMFLRFFWDKLKRVVYFRKVHHPGTKGYFIMEKGAKFGIPRLENKIITEINTFMQGSKMVQ